MNAADSPTLVGVRLAVTDWEHGELTALAAMRTIRAALEIEDKSSEGEQAPVDGSGEPNGSEPELGGVSPSEADLVAELRAKEATTYAALRKARHELRVMKAELDAVWALITEWESDEQADTDTNYLGCARELRAALELDDQLGRTFVLLLQRLARRCHNGAPDPWQEFYDRGYSPMLDRLAAYLERAVIEDFVAQTPDTADLDCRVAGCRWGDHRSNRCECFSDRAAPPGRQP